MKGYQKFWAALFGGTGAWLATAGADDAIALSELGGLLIAIGTAFGVRQIRNSRK